MARAHQIVDEGVLIVASIFHDFMKTRDYERIPGTPLFRAAPYQKSICHVSGSHAYWFYVSMNSKRPKEFVDAVSHCILAHHGRPEWGSPVEPQTVEAAILHYADMLSARYGRNA
jgi:3'-5' exoribonuclease